MKIRKTTLYFFGILVLIGLSVYLILTNLAEVDGVKDLGVVNGDSQKVVIGMKNFNYYPQVVRVKVNQPVEIYLDDSVQGCFRSFTIRDFGVNEYLENPEDKIIFTPTKTGSFRFACSMGMGTGTLIVE